MNGRFSRTLFRPSSGTDTLPRKRCAPAGFPSLPIHSQKLIFGRFCTSSSALKITVLVGPRNDFCYSDHIDAIEKLAKAERDRINKAGGISGRHVEIQIRDDEGDARRTVANVSDALADPNTIALIGLQSADRAGQVFKQLGPRLAESGIPWISSISVTSMFASYPNVFTMQGSQEEENIPLIAAFLREKGFARPAYIGFRGRPIRKR